MENSPTASQPTRAKETALFWELSLPWGFPCFIKGLPFFFYLVSPLFKALVDCSADSETFSKAGCLVESLTVGWEAGVLQFDFHYLWKRFSTTKLEQGVQTTIQLVMRSGWEIKLEQRCSGKMKLFRKKKGLALCVYVPSDSEIQDLQRFKHTESVNPPWVFTVV